MRQLEQMLGRALGPAQHEAIELLTGLSAEQVAEASVLVRRTVTTSRWSPTR